MILYVVKLNKKCSMKIAKIIFIIISAGLVLLLIYAIANTYVSLKYEIDEASIWSDTISINLGRQYLLEVIDTLCLFLCYVLATTVFLIICLAKDRKRL